VRAQGAVAVVGAAIAANPHIEALIRDERRVAAASEDAQTSITTYRERIKAPTPPRTSAHAPKSGRLCLLGKAL
jgi:hypothetical protein